MDRNRCQQGLIIAALAFGCAALPAMAFADNQSGEWPDLTGTWDFQIETTSKSDVPVLGEVRAKNQTRRVVEIAQQGDELRIQSRVCALEIEPGTRLASTTIPQAFVDSIDPVVRPARLERSDGEIRLIAPKYWNVQGAKLEDPGDEELPEEPDDDRVFDQDRTGHPGVTVEIGGVLSGEAYVVQKGWEQWFGRVDGDSIAGFVNWGSDQEVLDASSRLLMNQPDSEPVEERSENRFRMQRRDPSAEDGC